MTSGKKGIKKVRIGIMVDIDLIDVINQLKNEGYKINVSKICGDALKEYIQDGKE